MLRALCMGDMDFFEGSVAVRSQVPLSNARAILHSRDRTTISTILKKADLPAPLRPAFAAAIAVADDTDYDGGAGGQERFRRRMIERIITNFENPDEAIGDDNIEYLLAQLSQIDSGFSADY